MSSKNQCLLILGESKIGKSTILKKIINNLKSKEYNVGGFITKPKKLHKNEFGFDMIDLTTLNQVYYASNNFNIGPKIDQVRVSINELSEFCKNRLNPTIPVSDGFILDKIFSTSSPVVTGTVDLVIIILNLLIEELIFFATL